MEHREDLHATRVQALKNVSTKIRKKESAFLLYSLAVQALTEERKIYCLLVECLCSVSHSQITYNAVVRPAA